MCAKQINKEVKDNTAASKEELKEPKENIPVEQENIKKEAKSRQEQIKKDLAPVKMLKKYNSQLWKAKYMAQKKKNIKTDVM